MHPRSEPYLTDPMLGKLASYPTISCKLPRSLARIPYWGSMIQRMSPPTRMDRTYLGASPSLLFVNTLVDVRLDQTHCFKPRTLEVVLQQELVIWLSILLEGERKVQFEYPVNDGGFVDIILSDLYGHHRTFLEVKRRLSSASEATSPTWADYQYQCLRYSTNLTAGGSIRW